MTRDDDKEPVDSHINQRPDAESVAVVIATYNRGHLIARTIDSLLAQTRPPDALIVVDDGSTDDTAEVLAGYGDRLICVNKSNGGKSSALNAVLPQIDSTYVCFFDDDDIALPEALETHLDALRRDPSCDFTYSPNYHFEGEPTFEAIRASTPLVFPDIDADDFFIWIMESRYLPPHMQGMLIATHAIDAVGGFDESLLRSQDLDMVLRLARRFRACRIDTPTWAMRRHSGARGPGFELHKASDSYAVWQHYKRQVFMAMRATLSLDEYLPGPHSTGEEGAASESERASPRALIQRALIMANHGLFDEARADLRAYCEQAGAQSTVAGSAETVLLRKLFSVPTPGCTPPKAFYLDLGRAAAASGTRPLNAAKSMGWSIARMRRRKEYRMLVRNLSMVPLVMFGAFSARKARSPRSDSGAA